MEVGGRLRGLSLERYEAAFRDNDVDADVLASLTAEDLIALGVASVGHRRKLLAAIAALRDGRQPAGGAPEPAASATTPPTAPRGRRRPSGGS